MVRLDVTDCDIAEDAMIFQEYLNKLERVQKTGTSYDVMNGESLPGIQEIIDSISRIKKKSDRSLPDKSHQR